MPGMLSIFRLVDDTLKGFVKAASSQKQIWRFLISFGVIVIRPVGLLVGICFEGNEYPYHDARGHYTNEHTSKG